MDNNTQLSVDALLSRLDHVRQLARGLVRDAVEADEVVAEALARATSKPVLLGPEPEGWFQTVLRNIVRDRARSESRRRRREAARARPERTADTSEIAAGLERDRDVVTAVLSLEEPYRTAILLRFFEDLTPAEIARRTGSSGAAVTKHLQRGKQQLREKLEDRYGDRGSWAVALIPLVGEDWLAGSGAGLGLGAKVGLGAAALTLGGGLWIGAQALLPRGAQPPVRAEAALAPVAAGGRTALDPDAGTRPSEGPGARALAADAALELQRAGPERGAPERQGPSADASAASAAPDEAVGMELDLLDLAGGRLSDFPLRFVPWDPAREPLLLTSDAGGRIQLPASVVADDEPGDLVPLDADRLVVFAGSPGAGPARLVVAEAVRLGGQLTDTEGRPLAGVELRLELLASSFEGLELHAARVLPGGSERALPAWTTDEEGRFGPLRVPKLAQLEFALEVDGAHHSQVVGAERDVLDLAWSVPRLDAFLPREVSPPSGSLTVALLDAEGRPAEGYVLAVFPPAFEGAAFTSLEDLERASARLDVQPSVGAFYNLEGLADAPHELAFCDPLTRRVHRVQNVRPGDRPLEFRLPSAPELQLVEGRVLDLAGRPIEGASVFASARLSATREHYRSGGRAAMTDAEGRFRFGELCIDDLELQASPPDRFAQPGENTRTLQEPGAVEFRVARFAWVQVDVERPKFIDGLEFLDAAGRPLTVDVHLQSTIQQTTRVEALPRRAGFPRVQVPQNAVEVVLRRRTEITARAALELDFERTTRVALAHED